MLSANAADDEMTRWLHGNQHRMHYLNICGHNRGQNIPMNDMLDEAVRCGADWFVRVDDDCFFETPRQWVKHLLSLERFYLRNSGRHIVIGPVVKGLRNPIAAQGTMHIRAGKAEMVPILGGICRIMPMSLMRYFRFNERMPMGFGEASQLANFCAERNMPMVRDCTMTVTHGDSTDAQEAGDSDWSYEHAMLQALPYGL